ncbi:MAG TPA: (S)-ureidoglycine aminohydrolase [Candidatus Sulfotelmatobacter sp.]|jgi:(S)-ureidoglycine aminohydrolase|nr:(S)-ureidoglycine aminohydrolase [Candidatus Sulfotelmatobacter sp.]
MPERTGFTRTVVKRNYALITPDGFVPSVLPGWRNAVVIIHIAPVMGGPRFTQLTITLDETSTGAGDTGALEHFYYIQTGGCTARVNNKNHQLAAGSYLFLPPKSKFKITGAGKGTKLIVFQKKFEPLAGEKIPDVIAGHADAITGKPFLGHEDARLQVLLPDHPSFDMAVNIFTYDPGATLPFVETHIMEHGLLMLSGRGIYRLGADRHRVTAGDVIWMASYCPQWFIAQGRTKSSYIYYKDVNRAPL